MQRLYVQGFIFVPIHAKSLEIPSIVHSLVPIDLPTICRRKWKHFQSQTLYLVKKKLNVCFFINNINWNISHQWLTKNDLAQFEHVQIPFANVFNETQKSNVNLGHAFFVMAQECFQFLKLYNILISKMVVFFHPTLNFSTNVFMWWLCLATTLGVTLASISWIVLFTTYKWHDSFIFVNVEIWITIL